MSLELNEDRLHALMNRLRQLGVPVSKTPSSGGYDLVYGSGQGAVSVRYLSPRQTEQVLTMMLREVERQHLA